MMTHLLSIITIIAETVSVFYICEALLEQKVPLKYLVSLAVLRASLFFFFASFIFNASANSFIKNLFSVVLWIGVVIVGYKGKFIVQIFTVLFSMVFIAIFDLMVLTVFCFILDTSTENLLMNPPLWVFCTFISKSLLFTTSYFIKQKYKSREKVGRENKWIWWSILLIPVFTILNLYIYIQTVHAYDTTDLGVFLNALGLLITNIVLVILLDCISQEQQMQMENMAYKNELKNREEIAQEWIEAFHKQRRITHDFNHHLDVINCFIQKDEIGQCKEYMEDLSIKTMKREVIDTNNPIINRILNQKYWEANAGGISVSFMINDLMNFPLKSTDLVTVLSNLLDNAIEACNHVEKKKQIVIKILDEPERAILSIRNTSEYVEIQDDSVKTTKKNQRFSGFGIPNIKSILNMYDAIYALNYEDGWFQFTAIIYY